MRGMVVGEEQPGQPLWECIRFTTHDREAEARSAYRMPRTFAVDGGGLSSEGQFLNAVGTALRFSDYFGYVPETSWEWNGFFDGLKSVDSDTIPATDYLLVIRGATHLWRALPETMGVFVGCWLSAAEIWAKRLDVSFDLLFVW